jgi:hypothetical protein
MVTDVIQNGVGHQYNISVPIIKIQNLANIFIKRSQDIILSY